MELSVIFVLYNEFDIVKRAIRSVYREKIKGMEIIIIDNSSEKISKDILKEFPKIRYIKNKINLGFGPAVNIGIKKTKGEFILILTPDIIVFPGTIKKTLAYIKTQTKVALVGCKIYSYPKIFQQSGFHTFPNLSTHLFEYNMVFYKIYRKIFPTYHPAYYSTQDHQKHLFPKHIIGAYMLLRKKSLQEVGSFDNRFRLYREETDLCKRLHDKNWEIAYIPIDGLVHYGGSAWKKTTITQALPQYMESTYLFFQKHYGKIYMIVAWKIGILSAAMSIPFLAGTVMIKKILGQKSQSETLLPLWISIFRWHISNGIKIIFI